MSFEKFKKGKKEDYSFDFEKDLSERDIQIQREYENYIAELEAFEEIELPIFFEFIALGVSQAYPSKPFLQKPEKIMQALMFITNYGWQTRTKGYQGLTPIELAHKFYRWITDEKFGNYYDEVYVAGMLFDNYGLNDERKVIYPVKF